MAYMWSSVVHPELAHGQTVPLGAEWSAVRSACKDGQEVVAFSLSEDAIQRLTTRFRVTADGLTVLLQKLGVAEVSYKDYCWDDHAHAQARELLYRLRIGLPLPQLIHACPKWASVIHKEAPALIPCISKTIHKAQRQGLCVRQQLSVRRGILPERIMHVMVVGCTARKEALLRGGFDPRICGGAEHVLTACEVEKWLMWENVKPSQPLAYFPAPCVQPHGRLQDVLAHAILLTTGVAPAADFLPLAPVAEHAGLMEGQMMLDGRKLRVATVRGVDNALALLNRERSGMDEVALVEVLSCTSRCTRG